MRPIERAREKFYYKLLIGDMERVVGGKATGVHIPMYSIAYEMWASISPAIGSTEVEQFGTDENYERTIVVGDVNCPIDEHTILWVDNIKKPGKNTENTPHDYIVTSVSKSLFHIRYGIKKVE